MGLELFKVSRRQIETMLASADKFHVGTFYGILFEPWFHTRITERGYTGRIRKLSNGRELAANKKRGFFRTNKEIATVRHSSLDIESVLLQ